MSDEAAGRVGAVVGAVAFDCADPVRVGRFWQALLGGELRRDEDGVVGLYGGRVRLDFARVPEKKQVKNRVHLDLQVPPDAKEQAIANALSLGASVALDIYDGDLWRTMRDPEGNEFCFVWGAGSSSSEPLDSAEPLDPADG